MRAAVPSEYGGTGEGRGGGSRVSLRPKRRPGRHWRMITLVRSMP
jgi:hypothetical protein